VAAISIVFVLLLPTYTTSVETLVMLFVGVEKGYLRLHILNLEDQLDFRMGQIQNR